MKTLQVALTLACSAVLASAVSAGDSGGRLRVLMVCDTRDIKIGKTVEVDKERLLELLKSGVPQDRLEVTVLQGTDITPAAVLRYYRELRIQREDSILTIFSGHGGYDRRRGHFLLTKDYARSRPNAPVLRSTVLREMLRKRARLTVLLTDCCANLVRLQVPYNASQGDAQSAMNQLFFQHKGLVDLNGCSRGQLASCNELLGGFFLCSFIDECRLMSERKTAATWESLFRHTCIATQQLNPRQTPCAMVPLNRVKYTGMMGIWGGGDAPFVETSEEDVAAPADGEVECVDEEQPEPAPAPMLPQQRGWEALPPVLPVWPPLPAPIAPEGAPSQSIPVPFLPPQFLPVYPMTPQPTAPYGSPYS